MKRLLTLMVLVLFSFNGNIVIYGSGGKQQYVVSSEENPLSCLPEKAKQFVKRHFEAYEFKNCKKEKSKFTLFFSSMGYLEFSPEGDWRKIDGIAMQLPSSLLEEMPDGIGNCLKKKYSGSGLRKVSKKKDGYIVRFIYPKTIKLKFDLEGNLIEETEDPVKSSEVECSE